MADSIKCRFCEYTASSSAMMETHLGKHHEVQLAAVGNAKVKAAKPDPWGGAYIQAYTVSFDRPGEPPTPGRTHPVTNEELKNLSRLYQLMHPDHRVEV